MMLVSEELLYRSLMEGGIYLLTPPVFRKKPVDALTGWVKPFKIYFDKHRIEFIKVKP
jgi:hypothetical protein